MTQKEKAERLREMHHGKGMLVLPNAWDAASARLLEIAGFNAIATTSGGVAAVFGYADGQHVPGRLMIEMAGRIAQTVDVPVTADLEAGYGNAPNEVREMMRIAIETGIVGMNIEDGIPGEERRLRDIGYQEDVVGAVRSAGEMCGVPVVINARVDCYFSAAPAEEKFKEAIRRGNAYLAAGADCVFVIGVQEVSVIERLVKSLNGPLNVMWGPAVAMGELERAGVKRLSFGSALMRGALPDVKEMAERLLRGETRLLEQEIFTHQSVNGLFAR